MQRVTVIFESTIVEDIASVEDLILAKAELKIIDDGFQELKINTPEWVLDKMSEINREITVRVEGELQRRLKQAKARRSALRTADEKRKDLDVEIADLESRLK